MPAIIDVGRFGRNDIDPTISAMTISAMTMGRSAGGPKTAEETGHHLAHGSTDGEARPEKGRPST